eukprot:4552048-Prymnesium_polylepis.1
MPLSLVGSVTSVSTTIGKGNFLLIAQKPDTSNGRRVQRVSSRKTWRGRGGVQREDNGVHGITSNRMKRARESRGARICLIRWEGSPAAQLLMVLVLVAGATAPVVARSLFATLTKRQRQSDQGPGKVIKRNLELDAIRCPVRFWIRPGQRSGWSWYYPSSRLQRRSCTVAASSCVCVLEYIGLHVLAQLIT